MNLIARTEAALRNKTQHAIVWEETACPLCGSRRWIPLIEAPDNMPGNGGLWFAVVRCPECDLCFTNPRP
ncbi:MAG TPA: hypothetical protein VGY77_07900, partial [Gemmataceae bacterium]|nr:hypothetical protein [Gemmataceae bacterium]